MRKNKTLKVPVMAYKKTKQYRKRKLKPHFFPLVKIERIEREIKQNLKLLSSKWLFINGILPGYVCVHSLHNFKNKRYLFMLLKSDGCSEMVRA